MMIRGRRKFFSRAGIGVAGVAVAALATACGSSDSGGSASSGSSTPAGSSSSGSGAAASVAGVKAMNGDLGTFLSDSSGKTLYLFAADTGGKSTCDGACAAEWPPLTTKDAPKAGAGVTASDLSTVKRGDGTSQVVYHGHPLYYYAGDSKAGDATGQGVDDSGAKWYVVSPSGDQITKQPAGGSGGGSTDGGGSGSDAGGGWS